MKNNKTVLSLLAVIVVLLSVVVYLLVEGKVSNRPVEVSSNLAGRETDYGLSEATVNWKIYTDSEYGYSFKYPESWSQAENGLRSDKKNINNVNGSAYENYWMYSSGSKGGYEGGGYDNSKVSRVTEGIVSGYKSYTFYSCEQTCGLTTYIDGGDKTVRLFLGSFEQGQLGEEMIRIYNLMLSTFRFE